MSIGESLKENRQTRNLSLKQLENATGISNQNLSRWENDVIPGVNFCIQLAQYYGITLDELVGLSDIPPEREEKTSPPPQHYSQDEQQLIETYRALSQGKKKALFDMLDITPQKQQRKGDIQ